MSSVQLTTESSEPEIQFNNGIRMIVSAYETQTSILSNEIGMLNAELEKKNSKITEMEELCSSLLKEKSEYESKLSSLSSTNAKLTHQLDILIRENKELKNVKEKILSTLEKKEVRSPKLERQLSQPQLLLKKPKAIMRNGSDFDDLINMSTPSLTTSKKAKLTNQGRSALYSSIKNNYYTNHSILPNKTKRISHSEKNSFNETSSLNSNYGYNGNNNNAFFKKCRSIMKSEEYNEMREIVHMFNSKQITKEETYKKISDILSNGHYNDLIQDLDLLFS